MSFLLLAVVLAAILLVAFDYAASCLDSPSGFQTVCRRKSVLNLTLSRYGAYGVFGIAMPGKTIAYFLRQLSDRLQPEKRMRFINAGVTGYHSSQEFIHFQFHVLSYHPVMVIALTGRNDAFDGLHPQFQPDAIPYHGLHIVNWLPAGGGGFHSTQFA